LDEDTASAVSANTVLAGLLAPKFYDAIGPLSFTSSKVGSHSAAPDQTTVFSVLEGQPHNLVHNCIGGVGHIDPGPYGNMTNFLSPVDPIFFLHHANMDRLWDVWTRKQQSLKQPYLPDDPAVLKALSDESFLFFVNSKGQYVLDGKAGDYLSRDRFDYEYDNLGFGENLIGSGTAKPLAQGAELVAAARIAGNAASVAVQAEVMPQRRPAAENSRPLIAQITLERPASSSGARQFRVFVGVSADATNLGTDSPFYAGTVGFFGPPMAGMQMSHEATFLVPLRPELPALRAPLAATARQADLAIRVVPIGGGKEAAPVLKAVSIGTL
jgi:tyrosinase